MCGIAGAISRFISREDFIAAFELLNHRGPDSSGHKVISIPTGNLYLANNRLAIQDIESRSNQPFVSEDERYTLVFNGEIYNYVELRQELVNLGCKFRTTSDTEVLLQAWVTWGVSAPSKFEGMFAFAIYDKYQQNLYLVRDQFAQKPLFYFSNNSEFFFSSEIKSLRRLTKHLSVNHEVALNYLSGYSRINQQNSFFDEIRMLSPGSICLINLQDPKIDLTNNTYIENGPEIDLDISDKEYRNLIQTNIINSIEKALRSDREIAIGLSGGIDSTIIAGVANYLSPMNKLKTFSFISDDKRKSEEPWIDLVVNKFGLESHKCSLGLNELISDIPVIIELQEEPFQSLSIAAQYALYRKVFESNIHVLLDGQGADEIFLGYTGFPLIQLETLISAGQTLEAFKYVRKCFQTLGAKYLGFQLLYLSQRLGLSPKLTAQIFNKITSPRWIKSNIINSNLWFDHLVSMNFAAEVERPIKKQIWSNIVQSPLPELVRYADRNSMHFSIESRQPFLNQELLKNILRMPITIEIEQHKSPKSLLKETMRDFLPSEIAYRTDKIGFEMGNLNLNFNEISNVNEVLDAISDFPEINRNYLKNYLSTNPKLNNELWRLINFSKWKTRFI